MISDLDAHVGRVLAALEAEGLTDRTLVIFTSDNGPTHPGKSDGAFHIGGADPPFFNSTAGLRGHKGSVYEGGLRVPMIARLPGRIPAGRVCAAPGYFADWFPTLAEAASLEKPPGIDGESLWPVLAGGAPSPRTRPMLWVFPEYGGQVAVRLGDFKLVRQRLNSPMPGPWEVYDVVRAPGESADLAAAHPALIAEAEDVLRREVEDNPVFPVLIPGVTDAVASPRQ